MSEDQALPRLAEQVCDIARAAGDAILEIYERGFDVELKGDGSPLTAADRRAHELISKSLAALDPQLPVLSEESAAVAYETRRHWERFWLVDPLDGTKEFVKRNGEFTVNIALIERDRPVLGVVHTPVSYTTHWGWEGSAAYRRQGDAAAQPIAVRRDEGVPTIVASRSHGRGVLKKFLERVERERGGYDIVSFGSALKICLVAEGKGDIYPRFGPTSEWDTAAAHCVLHAAGGRLTDCSGKVLRYNKPSILNPWFMALGDTRCDWYALAAGLEDED